MNAAPHQPSARFDVVALGEGMVEFNQTTPGQPMFLQGFGGDTSNAVIAAARAGARTAYLSRVGDDWCGQRLLALWRQEGVDAGAVEQVADAPTGLYFVTHGEHGHAFDYQRKGSAAARMSPEWFAAQARATLEAARILHVSGISLAISPSACATTLAAMRHARAVGTQVAFDTNLRLKLWTLEAARAAIAEAAALCDWLLPSLDDAVALCGQSEPHAVIDWAHGLGAPNVVLKLGAEGCLISQQGQPHAQRLRLPGHAVTPVDATGAGDCFCGNLLARVAAGDTLEQAARYANAAAALAVQGFGAVAPLPRPEAVKMMLGEPSFALLDAATQRAKADLDDIIAVYDHAERRAATFFAQIEALKAA